MTQSGLRGQGIALPSQAPRVGLPTRVFLYTLDQISVLLDVDESQIKNQYVYFEGRSIGSRSKHLMIARNIAPPDKKAEWRIAEREFVRWLKVKGFRHYERGAVSS